MASTLNKVLVYVRNSKSRSFAGAKFNECIFNQLGAVDRSLTCSVICFLKDNRLCLELSPFNAVSNHHSNILKHPPDCPVLKLSNEERASLPVQTLNRGVDVGIVVVLESADECILITKRAWHMRTFPGVWVPPGGHIEFNETIEEAGFRELREETGLIISNEDSQNLGILCLWESVSPPLLKFGMPSRHHIVVYIHVKHKKTSRELEKDFKLNPEEVDSSIWIPLNLAKELENKRENSPENEDMLRVLTVNEEGVQTFGELDFGAFMKSYCTPGSERLSAGTRFVFSRWIERKTLSKELTSSL